MHAIGYLTQDPRYFEANGTKPEAALFRIMHNPWGPEGTTPDPIALDVTVSGKQAKAVIDYAKKGTQVYVSGRITKNGIAKDKEGKPVQTRTGETIVELRMSATEFYLLGKNEGHASAPKAAEASGAISLDNVPF